MTRQQLLDAVVVLVDRELNLEGGEMMLPLKPLEILDLIRAIEALALEAARDGVR